MNDCIFCKIIAGQISAEKVFENDSVVAFLDIKPINGGHVLVVPTTHAARYEELSAEIATHLAEAVHWLAPQIMGALGADGYNLGLNNGAAAGQIIDHVHWHIIPRYNNDGLTHWPNKMATSEELHVIAEKIRSTAQTKKV